MSSSILVFYAGLLYGEYSAQDFLSFRSTCTSEIYNGAYLYNESGVSPWFRMDLTPVLIADVPKELQALALLLT